MRFNPGVTLAQADGALRTAEMTWGNVYGSAQGLWDGYISAVHDTYSGLKQAFAAPDIGAGLLSPAYWNLLAITSQPSQGVQQGNGLFEAMSAGRIQRGLNDAIRTELYSQIKALQDARAELDALKQLAERPGLPVIYDTNMLNHFKQPGDIPWVDVLKDQGESTTQARLVVPLRVIDELDAQKYGQGDLARKAHTAIRYLERTLKDASPGSQVELRKGVTLEVWVDTDDRGSDADLSILRCAADLERLHPATGARVLTNDFGMRLRAQQMNLKVLIPPSEHRKESNRAASTE
ncbi:PIN domain-containing protein [Streptomyces rubiginosohelvolus]|uniref:PIN domain-containing protein n=1 Tax=Streptomyces rubiginosohelvolus TaxID=67362 RepID=UPI0035D6C404